jgi:hypothetical protein
MWHGRHLSIRQHELEILPDSAGYQPHVVGDDLNNYRLARNTSENETTFR